MSTPSRASALPGPLLVLFVASGATGIVFEVLWTRIFTSILGSSTQSVGAVVTAFMLGIGLGQKGFGGRADRGGNLLRLYGWLELGVGLSSLVAYHLFLGLDGVYLAAHRLLPDGAVKWGVFAVAFLVISVPAALIGGTLPVLVKRALAGGEGVRESLGRLYGANTLGAALGAFGAVVLVSRLGYELGYHAAVLGSLLTAALALALSRGDALPAQAPAGAAPEPPPQAEASVPPGVLALAFALSGFGALASEVLWQRLLEFHFQGTLVSFALILAIYLLGIGLGSLLTRRRTASARELVLMEALIAFLGLVGLPAVTLLAERGKHAGALPLFIGVVLTITFLYGAIFPLVGRLYLAARARGVGQAGSATGDISASNTLGSVLGSVGASFLLIPWLGTGATLVIAALSNVVVAVLVLASARQPLRGASAAVALSLLLGGLAWGSSDWVSRYYLAALHRPEYHLVAVQESSLQAVLVLEDDDGRRVLMGGPFQSGEIDEVRRQTQRLQAHLPMVLHPAPRRVLEIGYGVGEIARTVLAYEPERLDLVEIDPHMISVANDWFGALNARASESPRVRSHLMDGRQYLRTTGDAWDVILTDSMIPVSELSLRMYTREHFQAGRAHLAPGGVMVLWLPLNVGAERVRVMLRTFLAVFPESVLWLPQAFGAEEAFVVGFRDAARLDVASAVARFEAVARHDLEPFGWTSPAVFLASFRAGGRELKALAGEGPLHLDRAPVLDFIPTRDGLGLEGLQAELFRAARPLALDFMAPDDPLRGAVSDACDADRAFLAADSAEALAALVARYPWHPAARLEAAAALREGNAATAEARATQALEHHPWDVQANVVLMRAARARGDDAAAAVHAQRSLVLQPYLKEALSTLRERKP